MTSSHKCLKTTLIYYLTVLQVRTRPGGLAGLSAEGLMKLNSQGQRAELSPGRCSFSHAHVPCWQRGVPWSCGTEISVSLLLCQPWLSVPREPAPASLPLGLTTEQQAAPPPRSLSHLESLTSTTS